MSAGNLVCPQCGVTLRTANPVAPGKQIKCPKCMAVFAVPGAASKRTGAPAPTKKTSPAVSQSTRPAANPATRTSSDTGTLVAWTAGSGDDAKSHVVHVHATGLAWALGLKEPAVFGQLVGEATARPAEAPVLIEAQKGRRLPREQLARVAYTEQLSTLTVVDKSGKKQHIAHGKQGEQKKIFEAVGRYLGGKAREEDADAWSVMKIPLFALAVIAGIGGLFIWLAANSDPNAEITGRRAGMGKLINWLGYTIGPIWMSIIVGAIALLILSFMVYLLVKRPKRQVIEFDLASAQFALSNARESSWQTS